MSCHSERSEESKELSLALKPASRILRCAQNDKAYLVYFPETIRLAYCCGGVRMTTEAPHESPPVRQVSVAPHAGRIPHYATQNLPTPPESPYEDDGYTLTVIIPAYNEGDAIHKVIEKIRELRPDAEILVV